MGSCFTSLSTLLKSYWDNRKLIMKLYATRICFSTNTQMSPHFLVSYCIVYSMYIYILTKWDSKGNNSKSINARVMVLALCTSSNVDIYMYMKFREGSLNGFQVIERTRFWDRWRDRSPGEKQCLFTLKRGDIMKHHTVMSSIICLQMDLNTGPHDLKPEALTTLTPNTFDQSLYCLLLGPAIFRHINR